MKQVAKLNVRIIALALLLVFFSCVHSVVAQPETPGIHPLPVGSSLPGFELKDFIGKSYTAGDFEKQQVVVVFFFGTECPIAKLNSVKLQKLYEQHQSKNIAVFGIDSNQQDSIRDISGFAKINKIKFPLLKDPGNTVADLFGARRTPEVFVFGPEKKLRYRGAIDDQNTYGVQRAKTEQHFLVDAVKAILAGKVVQIPTTEPVGCHIGRLLKQDETSKITFSKQISRILQNNCVSCHRDGEVGPFSLTDYEEVAGWAEMIREVVNEKRMPPWHANPEHGDFSNDASLSKTELDLINKWVDAGAPQGDPADMPEPKQFSTGWQIGEPDLVVAMSNKPYKVPATGVVDYEHFVVDPGFKEDKWVKAAECRMGNRAVVHHIIVAADTGKKRDNGSVKSEWIAARAPGSPPLILPEGHAKLIPAGSKLIFQLHYTPIGTPQEDISKVGFIFADPSEVRKTVGTREIINDDFRIPPGADNHEVKARFRFRRDAKVLSLFPHMHLRGKSFRYEAVYPDGKTEILLDVPHYDFNWQNGYKFKEARFFPKGTIINCTAHFDNSKGNFANPDPTKTIRWGDQTWDEMMIGYFDMTWAEEDLQAKRE